MAFLELIKTIGAAFGTEVKPVGGIDPSSNAKAFSLDADGAAIADQKRYGAVHASGLTAYKNINTGSYLPIITVRVKAASSKIVIPTCINAVAATRAIFVALLNPSLTGASWSSASDAVEIDQSATGYTGGTVCYYGAVGNQFAAYANVWDIASGIVAGDTITIAARSLGGNTQIVTGIQWREW